MTRTGQHEYNRMNRSSSESLMLPETNACLLQLGLTFAQKPLKGKRNKIFFFSFLWDWEVGFLYSFNLFSTHERGSVAPSVWNKENETLEFDLKYLEIPSLQSYFFLPTFCFRKITIFREVARLVKEIPMYSLLTYIYQSYLLYLQLAADTLLKFLTLIFI